MLVASDGQAGERKLAAKQVVALLSGVQDYQLQLANVQLAEGAYVNYATFVDLTTETSGEIAADSSKAKDPCGVIVLARPEQWMRMKMVKRSTVKPFHKRFFKDL